MQYIIDGDTLAFQAASVVETRKIKAIHNKTQKSRIFKNRTELKNLIESNGKVYDKKDFTIEDIQEAQDFKVAARAFDIIFGNLLNRLNYNEFADTYELYMSGPGELIRHKRSRLLEYKGNRQGLKPIHLTAVKNYAKKKYKAELISGIETDDQCTIRAYEGYEKYKQTQDPDDKTILVSSDKDMRSGPWFLFNPDWQESWPIPGKDPEPFLIEGLGRLWRVPDKTPAKIEGYGRIWLWYQVLAGDPGDNYKASCHSLEDFGAVSAYTALREAKTDTQAMQAVVNTFRRLYPVEQEIYDWRKQKMTIDWKTVMIECFDLARMLRNEDDQIDLIKIMRKSGVENLD